MALRVVKVLAEEENQKGNGPVLQTLAVMEEHCKLRIGIFIYLFSFLFMLYNYLSIYLICLSCYQFLLMSL